MTTIISLILIFLLIYYIKTTISKISNKINKILHNTLNTNYYYIPKNNIIDTYNNLSIAQKEIEQSLSIKKAIKEELGID